MAFNNYLEDENDKPYFTTNSLAYYYDKMEGFAEKVEGSAKELNLTKEEVEKRITLYIEQNKNELDQRHALNKNELDQRLAQWDGKLETFDSSVETLLTEWVDDGTLTHVIDSTLIDQKIAPVAAQLTETSTKILKNERINLKEMLNYPTGFTFPFQLQIFKNAYGEFFIKNLDLESLHPLGKNNGKTYYVSKSGVDTNDGLTLASSFLTISKALAMPDVDTILIQSDDYGRQHLYTQNMPDRNVKIKSINGKASIGCYEDPADGIPWVLHSSGVYKYTRSGVVSVYDTKNLNSFGNYSRYTKKNTVAEVESEPGTWCLGTDNMLYVHTLDDRQPANNQDIKVVISGWTIESTRNRIFYFEGIEFQFGGSALKLSNSKLNLLKDCGFNYAQTVNGLSIVDSDMTISQNCISYENYADGFNYHADTWNTKQLYFLEVDNIGFRNGFTGTTMPNNNGSTAHVNCIGIRVGGLYFENFGPNCADVGSRQKTWNIGCTAYNSRQTPTAIDFLTENEMWLESCQAYGSAVNLYTQFENAKIHIRNTIWLNGKYIKTPSNLIEYSQ